jgi:hypothetical protein
MPQKPWRVLVGCKYGSPQVIVSPSLLENGSRFPNWAWLTCPYLCRVVAREEDKGACADWTHALEERPKCVAQLQAADAELRRLRAEEGDGEDYCAEVGLCGSKNPLKVKCIHAHVAYYLAGLSDPIGKEFLDSHARTCADRRCLNHLPPA